MVVPAAGLLPVLGDVLTKPLQNVINVIHAFTADPLATLLAVSGFIAPLISIPAAAVEAIQTVVSSVGTGDPKAFVNALISAPAVFLGGVLNGGIGPDLGPLVSPGLPVKAGGLLSSAGFVFNDDGSFYLNTGGPLYSLQQVLKMVKDAITPATTPAAPTDEVTAIPSAGAATVTLTTKGAAAPTVDTAAADAPPTEDAGVRPAAPTHPHPAAADEGTETAGAPSAPGDAASDPTGPASSTPEHDAEAGAGTPPTRRHPREAAMRRTATTMRPARTRPAVVTSIRAIRPVPRARPQPGLPPSTTSRVPSASRGPRHTPGSS